MSVRELGPPLFPPPQGRRASDCPHISMATTAEQTQGIQRERKHISQLYSQCRETARDRAGVGVGGREGDSKTALLGWGGGERPSQPGGRLGLAKQVPEQLSTQQKSKVISVEFYSFSDAWGHLLHLLETTRSLLARVLIFSPGHLSWLLIHSWHPIIQP